ncbi:unnamed protein product, partial [Mesorhabditis belari]|uniref:F-box domain-containing protein n=1 Tax=Mesorhabditis belari TaxID=2138241 RepID=A0AAF3ECB4_9BILA
MFENNEEMRAIDERKNGKQISQDEHSRSRVSFAVKNLSNEMKLTLLDKLEVDGVIKLVQSNKTFRQTVFAEPWRVFGKEFAMIRVSKHSLEVQKAANMETLYYNADFPIWRFVQRLQFGKLLEVICPECDDRLSPALDACCRRCHRQDPNFDLHKIFPQLKQIDKLRVHLHYKTFKKLFANFQAQVISSTSLSLHDMEIPPTKQPEIFDSFSNNSLKFCEKIELNCWNDDQYELYREALVKTRVKLVHIVLWRDIYRQIVESLKSKGVAGANPQASALLFEEYGHLWGVLDLFHSLPEIIDSKEILYEKAKEDYQKCNKTCADIVKYRFFRQSDNRGGECLWMIPWESSYGLFVKRFQD